MPDYVGKEPLTRTTEIPNPKNTGFPGEGLLPPFKPWSDELRRAADAQQIGVSRLARGNYVPFAAKNVSTRGATNVRKKSCRR